jgi:hypothetical protein
MITEIGKSLVFYLKYYPEMTRLFEKGLAIPGIAPRADPDLAKKIQDVGNAAWDEAADLLGKCTSDLMDRLQSSNLVRLKPQKRNTIRKNWGVEIDVWPIKAREPKRVTRQIGIHLKREGLVPWIWSRGGLAIEEKIMGCFGRRVNCYGSAKFPEWPGGAVSLETIRVPWEECAEDFTLSAGGVIAQTRKVCEAINPAFIGKFLALGL